MSSEAGPGDEVSLTISTNPDSYIGLLGVDQRSLLLKSGNDISYVSHPWKQLKNYHFIIKDLLLIYQIFSLNLFFRNFLFALMFLFSKLIIFTFFNYSYLSFFYHIKNINSNKNIVE